MVSNNDDDDDVDDDVSMNSTTDGYGYTMHKTDLKVRAHQSPTLGSLANRQYEIDKVITHECVDVHEHLMEKLV